MNRAILVVLACLALVASPVAVADSPSEGGGECVYTSSSGSSVDAKVSPSDCVKGGGEWEPS